MEKGYTAEDMKQEVTRCLECGCVALFDCDLRRYATEYGVEVKRFLGEANQFQIDNTHPLIELDPNKCVLCADAACGCAARWSACRRTGTSTAGSTPWSCRPSAARCSTPTACRAACASGPARPAPSSRRSRWPSRVPGRRRACRPSATTAASAARSNYDVFGDTLVKVSRDEANLGTDGHHCEKGRFGFAYVHAPERLSTGKIRSGQESADAPVGEAIGHAAQRLRGAEPSAFRAARWPCSCRRA